MMSFVIQSAAIGSSDANRRKMTPIVTVDGPESQTMRRTGGTFRSAISRSLHPVQKLCCSAILHDHPVPTVIAVVICTRDSLPEVTEVPRHAKSYITFSSY